MYEMEDGECIVRIFSQRYDNEWSNTSKSGNVTSWTRCTTTSASRCCQNACQNACCERTKTSALSLALRCTNMNHETWKQCLEETSCKSTRWAHLAHQNWQSPSSLHLKGRSVILELLGTLVCII